MISTGGQGPGHRIPYRLGEDIIAAYGKHPGVLIYADPPYLDTIRTHGGYENVYVYEMRAEGDHRALADALRAARAAIVLSGYHSPLYDELHQGWYQAELTADCGNSAATPVHAEVLWSNRPFPHIQADLFAEEAG
jgi:DNA adenine methylase